MAREEEEAPSWRRRCLQVFNGGHLIIVILSARGIAGSAVGVYTSLRADITESQRAIADISKELDKLQVRIAEREAEQKRYDAEVRGRVLDADQENTSMMTPGSPYGLLISAPMT